MYVNNFEEMDTPRSVLTFGEPLIVLVPDSPGKISSIHQFKPYATGAELNTAVGLARLGIQASFAGCVGVDPFGELICHAARAEGVNVRYIQKSPMGPTGMFFKQWSGLQAKTTVF